MPELGVEVLVDSQVERQVQDRGAPNGSTATLWIRVAHDLPREDADCIRRLDIY